MAVVFVEEITGRQGSKDVDTNKQYRRTWIVRTSSPQDGASVVLAAPGIPLFNDPYQYLDDSDPFNPVPVTDTSAVAVQIQASQDNANDPQDWRVMVDYVGVEDPVVQPAEVEYTPTRYQKSLVKDVKDKPVVNSAKDPFEGGITVDRTRFTLTIVKAVPNWDPVAAVDYQESLNEQPFLQATHPPGFAPGTCKLTWGAKRVRRQGTLTFYWLRTAVIDIDKEGWKVKVRDAGLNYAVRDELNPAIIVKRAKIMIEPGVEATSPQLLDGDGAPLLPGADVPDPLEFDGYFVKDWSGLGIEY